MRQILLSLFFLLVVISGYTQAPKKPSSSEIYESIKKLNFLGSVLYVAAHPDDENTQMISYFSNHIKARTAYLSITRGDGGQNLIGSELQELLGVIRTQELLAARKKDGGEQFFTRAVDFGYSKHPDETLVIWNKEEVLKDVVSIIRKFKPDIIINRFDHRTPGSTHGQHTSSAMLSEEAFDIVGNKNFVGHGVYQPWQPKRLFFNTSWWFYGSQENFKKADKSNMLSLNTGVFYDVLGLSNNEVAAVSRSQHKSQGFGSTGSRGSRMEYIELIKGDLPKNKNNVFDGIDTSWNRVEGGTEIANILIEVENNFDFKNPSASIPQLMRAYELISNLKDKHWRVLKTGQIKDIITACAGLYLEAKTTDQMVTPGSKITINVEAINRSTQHIELKRISISPNDTNYEKNLILKNNVSNRFSIDHKIKESAAETSHYWLEKKGEMGMYDVDRKLLIGNPETQRNSKINFALNINGVDIDIIKEIVYKYNDPVKGEVYEPFEIVPQVTASINDKVIVFSSDKQKEISVTVHAAKDNVYGSISLCYPDGWKVMPEKVDFLINSMNEKKTIVFKVIPPDNQSEGKISPIINVKGEDYTKEMIQIAYDHIPKQTVLLPSEAKVVKLNIRTKGQRIGYIQGAGDNVPVNLRQIGFNVIDLDEDIITEEILESFDAIILGIRTYNVSDKAKFYQKTLHKYVEQGGTLIVQYNTSRGLKVDKVAPYPLKLSRDRVTDESSEVIILDKNHPLINFPNEITSKDFEGWIQERGLYFPNQWAEEFTPILAMNDKGEDEKKGSLLVANYGKGYFIYTGLSFFRELPAGVPGAYKLFANMIAIGKIEENENIKN